MYSQTPCSVLIMMSHCPPKVKVCALVGLKSEFILKNVSVNEAYCGDVACV